MRDLIRAAGASSLSLPPDSPDLNVLGLDPRIEQLFAPIKALLRKAGARTKAALWNTIGAALQAFSPDECRRDLSNAGHEFQ